MSWCGASWCCVVWCGVVWCGVVWCGVVWCGVVWCDLLVGWLVWLVGLVGWSVVRVHEGVMLSRSCFKGVVSGKTTAWLLCRIDFLAQRQYKPEPSFHNQFNMGPARMMS